MSTSQKVCSLLATTQVQPALSTSVLPPRVLLNDAESRLGIKPKTLRDIFLKSKPGRKDRNPFGPAFWKLNRSVYVDVEVFNEIWRKQQAFDGEAP